MPSRPRRQRFDDDLDNDDRSPDNLDRKRERLSPPRQPAPASVADDHVALEPGLTYCSYTDSGTARGPRPLPPWLITSAAAVDQDLGVLKTGKEAEVSLVRRTLHHDSITLAAKRYRAAEHRLFHRDAGYLEGRRVRRSRETRAMATRTAFGKQLIAGQWAAAEFDVLCRCWSNGIAVPYPVQLNGTDLLMEFIGDNGVGAPRLAEHRGAPSELSDLWQQVATAVVALAELGYAHGDLSAYNVLVHDGRVVLIDMPQAVDVATNPQGPSYLQRDCQNIAAWFTQRGADADAEALIERATEALGG